MAMKKEDEMSQVGITKDKKVEEQHLDAVLTDFEAELRMLEEWLEKPRIDEEAAQEENETKTKF